MADQENNNSSKKNVSKEITVDAGKMKSTLQDFASALENNEDLNIELEGNKYTLPAQALKDGTMKVEFENKEGKYKVDIELQWQS